MKPFIGTLIDVTAEYQKWYQDALAEKNFAGEIFTGSFDAYMAKLGRTCLTVKFDEAANLGLKGYAGAIVPPSVDITNLLPGDKVLGYVEEVGNTLQLKQLMRLKP